MHRKKNPNRKQILFQIKQPEEMIYIGREESQPFPRFQKAHFNEV